MSRSSIVCGALFLCAALSTATVGKAEIKLVAGPLETTGSFHLKDKTRKSLSGVACPVEKSDGRHVCLVAFDEHAEARTIEIDENSYKANKSPIVLDPSHEELDAEAVTADDRFYYVTGSYANKRKDCDVNEASRRVFRIAYDHDTGLPRVGANGVPKKIDSEIDLSTFLKGDLKNSLGKCLGSKQGGLDIEGLAFYAGRLFFGLRGPTSAAAGDDVVAYVVEVPITNVDATKSKALDPFQLKVSPGRAIRDMAAVDGGILLLLGPDDDDGPSGWSIARWNVDEAADRGKPVALVDLGELDLSNIKRSDGCDERVKPEGMALLVDPKADKQPYTLAIFSDGMCDGGPLIIQAGH
ncbi:DUF3616 domain-containing protein [Rhizobium ruizarguesonis]|uniref:DUF3616 domain-containing protein n=1 Tax=Rhizobium ruizarguesonis TaxID=2081791 RepID=UPI0013EF4419|nr:DUF3616 domain-containing protein [Rhizobium ruizarguesonis]